MPRHTPASDDLDHGSPPPRRSVAPIDAPALIRPLIDPAKLATLGKRESNPRIQKITAILWQAKSQGQDPLKAANEAMKLIGWGGTEKGHLTAAMVRNVTILERLGCTTPEDLDKMHGKTAAVRKGPYAGQALSVDHSSGCTGQSAKAASAVLLEAAAVLPDVALMASPGWEG